ncbi:hypothetical protein AK830_g12462 [Neonectria ditissima]|uniref:Uncharacterized protein n=1 Tax=Neonectria ditissima TaxID=78410 RepID=A0A0N8H4R5_9HYPO|nr:hypothetical protein AK830_g12462 [Neonectria ditissima]
MCTYSFQQMVCSCAKGAACPQMACGRAIVGGEVFHQLDVFFAIDDLGAACDYQRRLFGRNAAPTMRCPRYAFDDKRVIKGSYRKTDLACVKCAETCAPPSTSWQAPGPYPVKTGGGEVVEGERERERGCAPGSRGAV